MRRDGRVGIFVGILAVERRKVIGRVNSAVVDDDPHLVADITLVVLCLRGAVLGKDDVVGTRSRVGEAVIEPAVAVGVADLDSGPLRVVIGRIVAAVVAVEVRAPDPEMGRPCLGAVVLDVQLDVGIAQLIVVVDLRWSRR